MHARGSVRVCFHLVDYLGQPTVLFQTAQNSPFVEYRRRRHHRHLHEHEWLPVHPAKKRVNIVISDMDTTNTCDRPLVKLLKSYCCEWNCQSEIFKKFQVSHRAGQT